MLPLFLEVRLNSFDPYYKKMLVLLKKGKHHDVQYSMYVRLRTVGHDFDDKSFPTFRENFGIGVVIIVTEQTSQTDFKRCFASIVGACVLHVT